jgi:hypothetical protein
VLAAGEPDIAIRAHQEDAVRPAENGLEALAGRCRRLSVDPLAVR